MIDASIYKFYLQTALGNPDAHWEKVTKMNLGIDFSFLNNTIAGTVELFKDKRNDILIAGKDVRCPLISVRLLPAANLGKAEVTGYELELRFTKNLSRDLRIWANASMTHAANKIINRDDPELKPAYQKQAGYAIGQTHSHINGGFMNTFDELYGSPDT